jgi:hypothetical protein
MTDLPDVEQMMVSLFPLLVLCRRETLPSARTADLSEDGEILDSNDDGLPSVKQTLASSKRAKRAVDFIGDDDGDREGDDG